MCPVVIKPPELQYTSDSSRDTEIRSYFKIVVIYSPNKWPAVYPIIQMYSLIV